MKVYLVEDLRKDGKPYKARRIVDAFPTRRKAEAYAARCPDWPARIIEVEIPDE